MITGDEGYKPRPIGTVGELIKQLSKYNKNARVVGYGSEYCIYHALTPTIIDAEDHYQIGEGKLKGKIVLLY